MAQLDPGVPVKNHPLALRMAVIAFLNYNISIACVWGSFSVVLGAVETHLGVGRELSTLAAPVISLTTALFATAAGVLAAKFSLRLIMLAGGTLGVAGFALLGLTHSYTVYLLAFGLLLAPAVATGAVLSPTLVTRWFVGNRGMALGIVCAPIVVGIMPLATNWLLHNHGLSRTYEALAALMAVCVVASCFIIDHPPAAVISRDALAPAAAPALGMKQILLAPRFWALLLAFAASTTGSIILVAHMVPMALSWGMSATNGASLLAIQSFAGIAGTFLFGWIADRLGGAVAIVILVFDSALLWLLLLLHPPFVAAAIIIAILGVHAAGSVPALGIALSQAFGAENFSRVYGLVNLVILPFSVLCVPAAALAVARTGSYSGAILGQAIFLAATCLLPLFIRRRRTIIPA